MLEKRIIDGKSHFVNVIENDDGSITEQYLDDYLDTLEKKKDKETKEMLKREKEELHKEKLKLANDIKEWKQMIDDAKNNVDILESDPNFLKLCSLEEKDAYDYLVNNKMRTTKKDIKSLLATKKWRYEIYPSIKDKREELNRRLEQKRLERIERNKRIGYAILTIGIIITVIIMFAGCKYELSR